MGNPRFAVPPPPKPAGEGAPAKASDRPAKPVRRDDSPFILGANPDEVLSDIPTPEVPRPAPEASAAVTVPPVAPPEPPAGPGEPLEASGDHAEGSGAPDPAPDAPPAPPVPMGQLQTTVPQGGPMLGEAFTFQPPPTRIPSADRLAKLLDRVNLDRAALPGAGNGDVGIVTHTLSLPLPVGRDLWKAGKPTSLSNAAVRWAISSKCPVHPQDFAKVFEVLKEGRRRPSPAHPQRQGKSKHTTAVLTIQEDQAVHIVAEKAGLSHAAFCESATYLYLYSVVLAPTGQEQGSGGGLEQGE